MGGWGTVGGKLRKVGIVPGEVNPSGIPEIHEPLEILPGAAVASVFARVKAQAKWGQISNSLIFGV